VPTTFLLNRLAFLGILLLALIPGCVSDATAQRSFYFSPAGDDVQGDGSAARPWASVERANRLELQPGDTLFFQGRQTFQGTLRIGAGGTPARPVVVTSYGNGWATFDAGSGSGIIVYNAGGVELRNLIVAGSGVATNTEHGITFYSNLTGGVMLDHVRVDSVDVSGFGKAGLYVGAGWRDVRVTHSAFHGNRDGMETWAREVGGLRDLYIGHSKFYDNPGIDDPNHNPTGSGILLGGVDGALVEYSMAFGNGTNSRNRSGPVGIWAYKSNAVVIQHNESWGNRTRTADGGGFDLDGGVTNSIMQYNYSHGNDGAGFGLYQYGSVGPSGGNIVRYNVSVNDGRKNGYGGISVYGASGGPPVGSADVYHNTVYMSPAPEGQPSAIALLNRNHEGITFRNNLLVTSGGVPAVRSPGLSGVRFEGNAYWSIGAPFTIDWRQVTYSDLDAWRAATGQELIEGEPVGVVVDPLLTPPGVAGAIGDATLLHTLDAYRLRPGSAVATAALDLVGQFGVDPGPYDFYGTPLGLAGGRAIGAHEPSNPSEGAQTVTVSGLLEEVDVAASALTIEGQRVLVTSETEVMATNGDAMSLGQLEVGMHADILGMVATSGAIAALSVTVQASSTSTGDAATPTQIRLSRPYPNPATAHAALELDLPFDADVTVAVFDVRGREILRAPAERLPAGISHPVSLDLAALSGGTYVLRVVADAGGRSVSASQRISVVQ
jgi:hypothetical protein